MFPVYLLYPTCFYMTKCISIKFQEYNIQRINVDKSRRDSNQQKYSNLTMMY